MDRFPLAAVDEPKSDRLLAAPERLVRLRLQILARHADVTQLPAVEALEVAPQARPLPMPPDEPDEAATPPSQTAADRDGHRPDSTPCSDFANAVVSIQ